MLWVFRTPFYTGWLTISLSAGNSCRLTTDRGNPTVELGVPQGSIFGPVIFNLYVADHQDKLQCPCYQYADDTTFYLHSKTCDLDNCVNRLNKAVARLGDYSSGSNLALNASKTKWMLLSTQQMSRVHQLCNFTASVSCHGNPLERVAYTKLLGVHLDEHLTWERHVATLLSTCYGVLTVLRKLKNLAPFHVRKQMVESLVISKLDYSSAVFHPLPLYQLKRLQRVQNVCAGYVLGRYAKEKDLRSLNWLSISERRDFNLLKLTHKALHNRNWPDYLRLKLHEVTTYNLRSASAVTLEIPSETGTFQDSAAKLFNSLPINIRNTTDYFTFCAYAKDHILAF